MLFNLNRSVKRRPTWWRYHGTGSHGKDGGQRSTVGLCQTAMAAPDASRLTINLVGGFDMTMSQMDLQGT